jgi:hypothetical protein
VKDKTNKDVKEQIILNITDEAFTIMHSETMDILDVYLVLSAALDYIEDEAEALSLAKRGNIYNEGT